MKIRLMIVFVLIGFSLVGCASGKLLGGKPPKVSIEVGNDTYETTLGTYCWGNTCVDTVGPLEILDGKEPIHVMPGETVSFIMNYDPKPNEVHVVQMDKSKKTEVVVTDNRFTAPMKKGIYYYAYSVWWTDEKDDNLSHGDAFYAFSLEVD